MNNPLTSTSINIDIYKTLSYNKVGKLESRKVRNLQKQERMMLMNAILREKNQITLPANIIKKMNLKKDTNMKIEVNEKGQIVMTPMAMVEKAYLEDLKEALEDVKKGNVSKAMSADELIEKLEL